MKEVIIHTFIDSIKIVPFLFVAFIFMEYIEHKLNNKGKMKIREAGKFGPIVGSLLGAIPQCGFSVMATNLYATRIITLGTLIAIYLSTSDEMLPILISRGENIGVILSIIFIKILIGIICGFIIDLLIVKNRKQNIDIKDFCEEQHCDCKHSLIKSSIKHTVNIFIFILVFSLALSTAINYFGEENLGIMFFKDSFFGPFISSLIGLIPNCASSVILTELYLNNVISFSSVISGLLTGSGVALLVLFKVNKPFIENVKIVLMLYFIGAFSGILIKFITLLI